MQTAPLPASTPPAARVRLDYLDGVRALAAMYVCLSHAMITVVWPRYNDLLISQFIGLPTASVWAARLLRGGHFAVTVFIVLSGYCLMLPVAKQGNGRLPNGVWTFLWRRARRILPPYYAALGLSLLLTVVIPGMKHPKGGFWSQALPVWDRGTLLSHLFLYQNWSWQWYFKIDPPAWSMATEGQIYLIFAFVLLPLSRRLGILGTALLAFWVHAEVHWRFNDGGSGENFGTSYDYVYWTYVGLFCLGMLGATVGFAAAPWPKFCRERLPWGVFAAFAWALLIRVCTGLEQPWMQSHLWLVDPMIGGATLCVLIFCTQALAAPSPGPLPLILRLLQFKPLVLLGGFSYSFYLIHFPVIIVLSLLLQPLKMSDSMNLWWMLGLCVPVCAAVSYAFHRVFERPFMPGHPTTANQAAVAAIVSPAP